MKTRKRKISQLTGSFRKRSPTEQQQPVIPTATTDDAQWIDKYSPTTISDVALHARKLKDVRQVLEAMVKGQSDCKILVLSGPAGSSKSTVTKLLAQELIEDRAGQIPYIEWINPIDSHMSQFDDFLNSVKFRKGTSKSIILVEDLPNVFHEETRIRFRSSLLQWAYTQESTPPLVICITECDLNNEETMQRGYTLDNNYNAETVLGKKLLNAPTTQRIKFNSVNMTLTKKHLSLIYKYESSHLGHIPTSAVKDQIARISKVGDIRSAIFAFQFWANWYSKDSSSSIAIGKESTISIFHAVGKCIHGTKMEDEDDNSTMNHVVKDFSTRSRILKLALLENYTTLNKGDYELQNAVKVIDGLSVADCIQPELESLEIATRMVRTNLCEVKGSSHSLGLVFPREWKVMRNIQSVKSDVDRYVELEFKKRAAYREFQDSNMFYGCLEPLIHRQRQFKLKSKLAYLRSINGAIPHELLDEEKMICILERLGGSFRPILGDDEPEEENFDKLQGNNEKYFAQLNTDEDQDSGSEFEDDPIDDSEEDAVDDELPGNDTTFEEQLLAISQRPTLNRTLTNVEILDDLDDDFEDSDF